MHELSRRRRDTRASAPRSPSTPAPRRSAHGLGNQATLELARRQRARQFGLELGAATDPAERHADAFAAGVARDGASKASPCACGDRCPKCAAKEAAAQANAADASSRERVERMAGPGRPLEPEVQRRLEARTGGNLEAVRVHTGARAARSASELGALAYSAGSDVVLGAGEERTTTSSGFRLLAHEVGHVLQHRSAPRPVVRRQVPGSDSNGTVAGGSAPPSLTFRVETYSIADYEAATGISASSLPEGQLVPPILAGLGPIDSPLAALGAGTSPLASGLGPIASPVSSAISPLPRTTEDNRCYALPGIAAGAIQTPMIASPFPTNSVGILWEGSHLSIFANANGELSAYGFRAGLPRHVASSLERLVGWNSGPFTTSLNQGVPGSFANDAIFPYNPASQALGRPVSPEEAAAFVELLEGTTHNETYRFSPPPEGTPAFNQAFPSGVCPGGGTNCLNVPEAEILAATGGQRLVVNTPQGPLDIATGLGADSRGLQDVGRASRMSELMRQFPTEAAEVGGLRRFPVGPAMLGRGAVGVIRAGGVVLMVYGVYRTVDHIANASPEELPGVVGEEAGSWIGGIVGTALGAAAVGGVACSWAGPGTFVCAAGGFVGGVVVGGLGAVAGAALGKPVGEYVGEKAQEGYGWLDRGVRGIYGIPF